MQSLSIKSSKSASLPIWSCKLGSEEGGRWHSLALEDEESEEDDETIMAEVPFPARTAKADQPPHRRKKAVAA